MCLRDWRLLAQPFHFLFKAPLHDTILSYGAGGAVAEWARASEGSNTAAATYSLRNFGNSVYPALPVVSEETLQAVGPFYLVLCHGK